MKERPILFSGPMVRATLDDRKTQTRRVVTNFPETVSNGYSFDQSTGHIHCHNDYLPPDCQVVPPHYDAFDPREANFRCPYGEPGDRLWVRETWMHFGNCSTGHEPVRAQVRYAADESTRLCGEWPDHEAAPHRKWWNTGRAPWTPGIHMPRWASRITLTVTSVRVERLQAITEEDARAEGCTSRIDFRHLWDSINGKRPGCAWADNPWVRVVGFERVKEGRH